MKKLALSLFTTIVLTSSIFAFQNNKEPTNGYEVIKMMHSKYEGEWYKNLEVKQKTIFFGQKEDTVRVQYWYEAMQFPGMMAIKFDSIDSNNGILFKAGKQYGFANGQVIQQVDYVHEILLLGFDVYHQKPDTTIKLLEESGYDLNKIYKSTWQGREVFVVGTDAADEKVPQFWIDSDRLLFVRNITIGRQNTVQEIQFNDYEKLEGGWIAKSVLFQANNIKGLLEEYVEIAVPDSLSSEIFDPLTFGESEWR